MSVFVKRIVVAVGGVAPEYFEIKKESNKIEDKGCFFIAHISAR